MDAMWNRKRGKRHGSGIDWLEALVDVVIDVLFGWW